MQNENSPFAFGEAIMWDGFLILLLVVSVVGVLGLLAIGMSELRAEKPAMDSGRQRAGSRHVG